MSEYGYVKENYEKLKREIEGYEERYGRKITLVAVTKSGTDEELIALAEAGATDMAENRPGELKRRAQLLRDHGYTPRFHEIGNLQRNKVNKIEKAGCHVHKSAHVNAPIIEEYPLTLECKVRSWDPETGYLIGEIVASQADESILTDGKVDLGKLKPIIFDPSFNVYRVVGEAVGNAFQDGLKLK